jgi:Cu2+-exporting ATPase
VEVTDRIAGWFVAGVLVVAALGALWWLAAEPSRAIWIAVAVLVVTCPCALSLATPTALSISVGTLARQGVVCTRGHAVETLSRVTHFVFDKTGTLTEGRLTLADVRPFGDATRAAVLEYAAALEQGSEHPLARAVMDAAGDTAVALRSTATRVRNVAGSGIEGSIEGRFHRIGTRAFVEQIAGDGDVHCPIEPGATPVWIGSERGWLGMLQFTDRLRPEAGALLDELRGAGMHVLILSGDEPSAVQAVAQRLGVVDFAGGCSPETKHARVRALQEQGAVVAMVGDGVNDAPVLAQAQLSVAMGTGAVLSQAQSDLVLLSGRLASLREALRISRRTMRIVRENLIWAVAYNAIALPLAVAGYVTPWLAGIGMAGSSLLVVLNALRLVSDAKMHRAGRGKQQVRGARHEARGASLGADRVAEPAESR